MRRSRHALRRERHPAGRRAAGEGLPVAGALNRSMSAAPQIDFPPPSGDFLADPYSAYARIRDRTPIFRARESGIICFTRHEDITRLLQDRRLGRTMDHT